MARLSNSTRQLIHTNWLRMRASKLYDVLNEQVNVFAYKIWNYHYGKWHDQLSALPPGLLHTVEAIKFSNVTIVNRLQRTCSRIYNPGYHSSGQERAVHKYLHNTYLTNHEQLSKAYFEFPYPMPFDKRKTSMEVPEEFLDEANELQQEIDEVYKKLTDSAIAFEAALNASTTVEQAIKALNNPSDRYLLRYMADNISDFPNYRINLNAFETPLRRLVVLDRNPDFMEATEALELEEGSYLDKLRNRGVLDKLFETVSPEAKNIKVKQLKDGTLTLKQGNHVVMKLHIPDS